MCRKIHNIVQTKKLNDVHPHIAEIEVHIPQKCVLHSYVFNSAVEFINFLEMIAKSLDSMSYPILVRI